MSIFAFLFLGLLAGWLAGVITGGRGFGILGDIIVGVLGSLVGGHALSWIGVYTYGLIGSLLAAVLRCHHSPFPYSACEKGLMLPPEATGHSARASHSRCHFVK